MVTGQVIDTPEEFEEPLFGHTARESYTVVFTYDLPDGRRFPGMQKIDPVVRQQLQAPSTVEIRYLPDHPEVSRTRGTGSETIAGWIWRSSASGGFRVLVLLPGLFLARFAFLGRRYRPSWWSRSPTILDLHP